MTTLHNGNGKSILERIARRVMQEKGFLTDFSVAALDELKNIQQVNPGIETAKKDLRSLLWASIDNDDSRDMDQLTVAEVLPDNRVKILVAVADVDTLVQKNSAINEHAHQNTTSIYTAGKTFPMLPERLSTDLTSLNYQADRLAIVIEMIVSDASDIQSSDIYPAWVRSHAKLAYNSMAAWLEGKGPAPAAVVAVPELAENLRVQDRVAQKLRSQRHLRGALELQTLEARPVFDGDNIRDLQVEETNRAKEIIVSFIPLPHKPRTGSPEEKPLMEYLIWYNTEKPHCSIGKIPPLRYYLDNFITKPNNSNMLCTLTSNCTIVSLYLLLTAIIYNLSKCSAFPWAIFSLSALLIGNRSKKVCAPAIELWGKSDETIIRSAPTSRNKLRKVGVKYQPPNV
jgi:hypothetical protein